MTKAADVAHVIKTYGMSQRASEGDIAILNQFLHLSPEARAEQRIAFLHWFQYHAKVRELEWIGSDEFFYPRFAPYLQDNGEFVEGMRERQQTLQTLEGQILDQLSRANPDDQTLMTFVRIYHDTIKEYVEHREAVFVPIVLAHFDPEVQRQADMGYRKRLGLTGVSVLLPWLLAKATPDEREHIFAVIPLPLRWLYTWVWEPRYQKILSNLSLVARVMNKTLAD